MRTTKLSPRDLNEDLVGRQVVVTADYHTFYRHLGEVVAIEAHDDLPRAYVRFATEKTDVFGVRTNGDEFEFDEIDVIGEFETPEPDPGFAAPVDLPGGLR